MVDEFFSDVSEHVHYYGVKTAYPDWDARWHLAQREAHINGKFFPMKAFEPDPERAWNAVYLVTGMEIYYGLWEDKAQALRGEIPFSTHAQLQENDPVLVDLIEELFPAEIMLKPADMAVPEGGPDSTGAPQ